MAKDYVVEMDGLDWKEIRIDGLRLKAYLSSVVQTGLLVEKWNQIKSGYVEQWEWIKQFKLHN